MSRYTVPCPTWGPDRGEAVVGWDARRATYFAQTYEYGYPDEEPTYAVGQTIEEIPTVVELVTQVYAFTDIDNETIAALLEDPEWEAAGYPPRIGLQPLGEDRGFTAAPPLRR
jgi:hypothetical protein